MICPFCKSKNVEHDDERYFCNDCPTSWTNPKRTAIVKKIKRQNGLSGDPWVFEFYNCPWCGYDTNVHNPTNYCSGCYTNYYVQGRYVYFDKEYRPKNYQALAFAKALNKMGGAKFGT